MKYATAHIKEMHTAKSHIIKDVCVDISDKKMLILDKTGNRILEKFIKVEFKQMSADVITFEGFEKRQNKYIAHEIICCEYSEHDVAKAEYEEER